MTQKMCVKCNKPIPVSPSHIKYPAYYRQVKYCSRGCPRSKAYNRATNPRMYRIWSGIHQRTTNPRHLSYPNYGGRGIRLCERWQEFENFYLDMVEGYTDDLTIDRIDVNSSYNPENCRWVSMKVQGRNKRTCNYITYKNETKTLIDWLEETNVTRYNYYNRLNNLGWPKFQAMGLEARA